MLFYYSKPMPRDLGTCPYMYSISRHSRSGKRNHHRSWQATWTSNCPHSPPSAESNVLVAFNWSVHYYCFTVFAHSCMAYTIVAFFIAMRVFSILTPPPPHACFLHQRQKGLPFKSFFGTWGQVFLGNITCKSHIYMSFWSLDALKAKTLLSSKRRICTLLWKTNIFLLVDILGPSYKPI